MEACVLLPARTDFPVPSSCFRGSFFLLLLLLPLFSKVWDNTRGKHFVLRAIRCANSEDVTYILARSRLVSEITTVPGACPYLVKMLDSFSHLVGASYVVFVLDEYCDLGTLSEEPVEPESAS